MQFQVTEIEFDFTDDLDDEPLDVESQDEIYDEVLGTIWQADDEDDLIEEITCATGWCIKSIDYRHILN
jgi:adenine specific DNA methylase Mod